MACRNVDLGKLRAHKRETLLEATEKELQKVRARIENCSLAGRDKIGMRVGKVVNKYKVSKHFSLTIEDSGFEFHRLGKQIDAEAALDGIYVIRTSVTKKQMSSAEALRRVLVDLGISDPRRLAGALKTDRPRIPNALFQAVSRR
jgi:hypothetical protein